MRTGRTKVAVTGGVIATVLATGLFFAVSSSFPLEAYRRFLFEFTGEYFHDNPLLILRHFGGMIGGITAGYIIGESWENSAFVGAVAAIGGVAVIYLVVVGYNVLLALVRGFTPPVLDIVFYFFIFLLPLTVTHLLGGLVGGVCGWLIVQLRT